MEALVTRRFIRYLAATDSSPIGMLALGYLSGLLRIAPVRVGSMTGGMTGRWEHYAQLLATPMDGDFVNVVCCAPERWTWEQRVVMPTRRPDGTVDPAGEVTSARQELYTESKRNVLIVGSHPVSGAQLTAALRYEEIVTGSRRDFESWNGERDPRCMLSPHIISLPITDHEALRSVVMPP
jgi:hypothetical protein